MGCDVSVFQASIKESEGVKLHYFHATHPWIKPVMYSQLDALRCRRWARNNWFPNQVLSHGGANPRTLHQDAATMGHGSCKVCNFGVFLVLACTCFFVRALSVGVAGDWFVQMSRAPSVSGRERRRSSSAERALPSRNPSSALEDHSHTAVTRAIYHHARDFAWSFAMFLNLLWDYGIFEGLSTYSSFDEVCRPSLISSLYVPSKRGVDSRRCKKATVHTHSIHLWELKENFWKKHEKMHLPNTAVAERCLQFARPPVQ